MELAYDIAVADPDPSTNRRRLTMALRDIVSEQEASGKSKKCLTRVWLNPPSKADRMIAWALAQDIDRDAGPVLQFGALLATFPFVGSVCRVIGQHLQTEQGVEASVARSEVRRLLGDRPSVDVAARKTYTTLLNLGLLTKHGQTLLQPDEPVRCPSALTGWLAHALILTRQMDSVPESSVHVAPELLGLALVGSNMRSYPLLEWHSATSGEVLVVRD